MLSEMARYPGYVPILAEILASTDVHVAVRHMAGVLVKQLVTRNWDKGDDDEEDDDDDGEAGGYFEDPEDAKAAARLASQAELTAEHKQYEDARRQALKLEIRIPDDDKAKIKELLPSVLGDSSSAIRGAAAAAVAAIASLEFPDRWEDVLPGLVGAIVQRENPLLVRGAIRCLALFAEDIIDHRLVDVIKELYPALISVFSPAEDGTLYPASTRARALELIATTLYSLTIVEDVNSEAFEAEFTEAISETLEPMMELLSAILQQPLPSSDEEFSVDEAMFNVRAGAAEVITKLLKYFPGVMRPHAKQLLSLILPAMEAAVPMYLRFVIFNDDPTVSDLDEDSNIIGLSSFIAQCTAFISHLADEKAREGKCLPPHLPVVMRCMLASLMMTSQDVDAFKNDLNAFVIAEDSGDDDTVCCETNGAVLNSTYCAPYFFFLFLYHNNPMSRLHRNPLTHSPHLSAHSHGIAGPRLLWRRGHER